MENVDLTTLNLNNGHKFFAATVVSGLLNITTQQFDVAIKLVTLACTIVTAFFACRYYWKASKK